MKIFLFQIKMVLPYLDMTVLVFIKRELFRKGDSEFSCYMFHCSWYFSSKKNLKLFLNNPEKFVPELGGYCAFSLSFGILVDGNPNKFQFIDGKLYFSKNTITEYLLEQFPNRQVKAHLYYDKLKKVPEARVGF